MNSNNSQIAAECMHIRIMLQSHSHYTVLYMYIYCILCFHLFVSWSLTLWELCFPIHTVSFAHLVYAVYCVDPIHDELNWALPFTASSIQEAWHVNVQFQSSTYCTYNVSWQRGGCLTMNVDIHECEFIHLLVQLLFPAKLIILQTHTLLYIHTEMTIYITFFLHIAVPLFNLMDAGIANVLYTESCVSWISLSGSEWNERLTSAEIRRRDTRALYCGHENTI